MQLLPLFHLSRDGIFLTVTVQVSPKFRSSFLKVKLHGSWVPSVHCPVPPWVAM